MAVLFDPLDQLTPHQLKIVRLAFVGKSEAAICTELEISPGTLRWHTSEIRKVYPTFRWGNRRFTLTKRERAITRLVAEGLSNRDISMALNITCQRVANYLNAIYDKTQTQNRIDLALTVLIVQNRILIGATEAA